MSEKTLRASLYFLVSVVVLYLLVSALRGGGDGDRSVDPDLAGALQEIAEGSHELFLIEGPAGSIRLEMRAGTWTANGFDAESSAVERLIRAVEGVEVTGVAGTNPANHVRFGLTADSAWTFSAGDGAAVLLGKTGTRFGTAYARLPDSDVVSLIEGDLRPAAARSLADWRNKMILRADTAAVTRIAVAHGGSAVLYERQDSSWTVDGDAAEAGTVRTILQELAGLRASGFAPEDAEMPAAADRSVLATDADGNELASLSLAEREGSFWLLSSGSTYIFEIPTFRANRIAPGAPEEG